MRGEYSHWDGWVLNSNHHRHGVWVLSERGHYNWPNTFCCHKVFRRRHAYWAVAAQAVCVRMYVCMYVRTHSPPPLLPRVGYESRRKQRRTQHQSETWLIPFDTYLSCFLSVGSDPPRRDPCSFLYSAMALPNSVRLMPVQCDSRRRRGEVCM